MPLIKIKNDFACRYEVAEIFDIKSKICVYSTEKLRLAVPLTQLGPLTVEDLLSRLKIGQDTGIRVQKFSGPSSGF